VSWIDLDAIRQRKFKVAVDAINGAAAVALPELLDSSVVKLLPSIVSRLGNSPAALNHCRKIFLTCLNLFSRKIVMSASPQTRMRTD